MTNQNSDMLNNLEKQIKQRRKYLKVSQTDLAEMSGVSLRTIKAIEKGGSNPTIRVTFKLLEPLGLTLVAEERIRYE
jgi:putative transcriptional regulator